MIEALFGFIARLIACVLALVFILCANSVLQLRTADKVLLDPLTYQLALAETNTWLALPDLVTAEVMHQRESLRADAEAGDPKAMVITALEPQDLRRLSTLLLPPAEAQRVVEDGIAQGFDYLEMRRDTVALDLTGLKRNASGRNGAQAIEILVGTLPECATPGCPNPEQIAAHVDPRTLFGALPDSQPLIVGPADPDPREGVAFGRLLLGFAPLALLLLLALVALFGARSRAGWLRWSGVPLMLTGALALTQGAMAGPGIDFAWSQYLAEVDQELSREVAQHLRAVFEAVMAEFVRHLQFEGGAVALTGMALVLLSFFVPDRRSHGA